MRRRRRPKRQPTRPWTPQEDAALREVNAIGLCCSFWPLAIPDRPVVEMYERRLVLGIKPAPLI